MVRRHFIFRTPAAHELEGPTNLTRAANRVFRAVSFVRITSSRAFADRPRFAVRRQRRHRGLVFRICERLHEEIERTRRTFCKIQRPRLSPLTVIKEGKNRIDCVSTQVSVDGSWKCKKAASLSCCTKDLPCNTVFTLTKTCFPQRCRLSGCSQNEFCRRSERLFVKGRNRPYESFSLATEAGHSSTRHI